MLTRILRAAFGSRTSAQSLIEEGLALRRQGRLPDAERVLRRAVETAPHDAFAATNLGIVLLEQDRGQEGVNWLQRALECDSRCAAAHYNLGNVLRALGRLPEAITHYQAAANLDPELAEALEELMMTLLEVCDWDRATPIADRLRSLVQERTTDWMRFISPLASVYLGLDRNARKIVAAYHASQHLLPEARGQSARRAARAGARLKIGYFSRDFRDHPVGHLLRGVFTLHDRSRFEVFAYSFGPDDGSVYRSDIARSVDHFVGAAHKTDAELADTIAGADVDLLIDLMGHTTGQRLGVLARRPARVQAHYLGYGATTGADYIDYFITDRIATPPECEDEFTERCAFVAAPFMVSNGIDAAAAPPATRAEQHLAAEAFVFCNFSNSSRITQKVFTLWMEILRGVPDSVLWLKGSAKTTAANLRREAQACGVNPQRLVFAQRVADKAAHMARLGLADLALDTIGWHNGHSTSADLLWAGTPVLTVRGAAFATRVTSSLVCGAGMPELACRDEHEYVAMAVALGNDRVRSNALKRKVASNQRSTPFFDTAKIVAELERAYVQMCAAAL